MSKSMVELTLDQRIELCGGNPDEAYPIPSEHAFESARSGRLAAPDLERMAARLIAFKPLDLDHLVKYRLRVLWAKSGGSSGGKPRWGAVKLADPDNKFFTSENGNNPIDARIFLAAGNLREAEATRWQVANELAFQLCRMSLHTTQEGDDERLVLVGPDAAFFTAQMRVFGPTTPEVRIAAKAMLATRQMSFAWTGSDNDDEDADDDYDPTGHLPPAGEGEVGPVAGGAPPADWADPHEEPNDDTHDPETGLARDAKDSVLQAARDAHLATIRADYGTRVLDDGSEVCRRCGVRALEHPLELCAGGVQADAKTEPQVRSKNGNGQHDDALPLIDPDRVIQTLSQLGTQIVYCIPPGATIGQYQHPVSGEIYSQEWAEKSYRAAISNSKREKAGIR